MKIGLSPGPTHFGVSQCGTSARMTLNPTSTADAFGFLASGPLRVGLNLLCFGYGPFACSRVLHACRVLLPFAALLTNATFAAKALILPCHTAPIHCVSCGKLPTRFFGTERSPIAFTERGRAIEGKIAHDLHRTRNAHQGADSSHCAAVFPNCSNV